MNLNQFTPLQQFWHNTTFIDGTSSNTRIKDAGANQSWSLQNFFGIAMPLMVGTVLVPLVIGSIIRAFLQGLAQGRTWWRLLLAIIVIGYSIAMFWIPLGIIPFWAFTALQLFAIIRSHRMSWLRLVYWLSSAALSVLRWIFAPYPISGIYGISLFVFWWWKPEFYYRWDQGGRPKSKED